MYAISILGIFWPVLEQNIKGGHNVIHLELYIAISHFVSHVTHVGFDNLFLINIGFKMCHNVDTYYDILPCSSWGRFWHMRSTPTYCTIFCLIWYKFFTKLQILKGKTTVVSPKIYWATFDAIRAVLTYRGWGQNWPLWATT